jgi:hypothetical protein
MRSHRLFDIWEQHGYHVVADDFSQPIPNVSALNDSAWRSYDLPDFPVGLAKRAANYEISSLEGRYGFTFGNDYFTDADAAGLYTMLREYRPATVIEVGSGWSTRVTKAALEDNGGGEFVTIEPFPIRITSPTYRQPVQTVPLEVFDKLTANDVLFIDSSHVATVGSDVTHLMFRVVPRLAPRVLVHFHDIFLPDEYPKEWATRLRRFWNEQYLVHAFLLCNQRWEILWSSHHLTTRHPELVDWPRSIHPHTLPSSLWIRRLA